MVGWVNYLQGFTVYYNNQDESMVDHSSSLLLNEVRHGVPMVQLRQKRYEMLGGPYSKCNHTTESQQSCLYRCKLKKIRQKCGCVPFFAQSTSTKHCSIMEQHDCVYPIMQLFKNDECGCSQACSRLEMTPESIQYGQFMETAKLLGNETMGDEILCSMTITMKTLLEVHREVIGYSASQVWVIKYKPYTKNQISCFLILVAQQASCWVYHALVYFAYWIHFLPMSMTTLQEHSNLIKATRLIHNLMHLSHWSTLLLISPFYRNFIYNAKNYLLEMR